MVSISEHGPQDFSGGRRQLHISYIVTGSYTIPVVPDVHRYFHFCSFPKKGDKESHVACFLPILLLP